MVRILRHSLKKNKSSANEFLPDSMTTYNTDTDLRGWQLQVRDSLIHGKGVFATKNFEKSELIIVLDDSRIVNRENPLDPEKGEFEYHCD